MRLNIRGVIYESVPAASKALGVSKSTIYTSLHRGTIDTVGLRGASPLYKGRNPSRSNPVSFFGGRLKFPNEAAAAKALGYSQQAFNKIAAGKTGTRSRENLRLKAMYYFSNLTEEQNAKHRRTRSGGT